MTSDSAIPNLGSNSAFSDAESNSTVVNPKSNSTSPDAESNSVIPDAELNSVLQYLKLNAEVTNVESDAPMVDEQVNSAPAHINLPDLDLDLEPISPATDVNSNSGWLSLNSPESVVDNKVKNNIQVQLKTEAGRLLVVLPTELQVPATEFTWSDIWQQLKFRLNAGDRLRTRNTTVHLVAYDRLLDGRQLQQLAETFSEVQLQLKSVATSRRQTAIAAVTSGYSVEQLQPETILSSEPKATSTPQADALYLEMTIRSGVEIRHPGTVILLGDINPGGIVVADGDILVWGRLRGIAHAGAGGNRDCLIMSLQMEPTQLRIADAVARAPEKSPTHFFPEVAHITSQGIRIVRSTDFSRNQISKINQTP
ncbi:septum site-determining protein MinC [Anabaena sp. FACHB-709]|uniref:Probable septum site-determining protein MinC n=3 Tax=Nostocaceae TaxID=1162 RepID=MINC_NOSS1|nr:MULTISPECIES: septum site-determining protein MinC [Nostocaceae]Q8YRJ1.1 RecName: Full=Probable septum site-determining protein MinC [Nostoc sp. PCC 7120 = FACHB-418]BAY69083.1 septum site-determining protein MinC [Trichormus variabilis NIES-23]MBD2173869.1 septum site-determining protein MinC [Anabaena cylindrica FACHB-318]MBD2265568.1 septum site-determining protein MinC [Anabaena sp. FACHB-709]MBD2274909.1 septum site-determining protein MinC [Nostoc sp. PCC 7120 = FACHB-418]MBD2285905.